MVQFNEAPAKKTVFVARTVSKNEYDNAMREQEEMKKQAAAAQRYYYYPFSY